MFNASPQGEPVALAVREHDLKRMGALLDTQPSLVGKGDQRSNQPIHWATMTRQLDAIDELLRRGTTRSRGCFRSLSCGPGRYC